MAARPKYSIGTKVRLFGEPVSSAPAAGEFAIISRHFLDTDDPRYRIRNLLDRHERSVGEDDIFVSVQTLRVEDASVLKSSCPSGPDNAGGADSGFSHPNCGARDRCLEATL
jgi:hypothetical protein